MKNIIIFLLTLAVVANVQGQFLSNPYDLTRKEQKNFKSAREFEQKNEVDWAKHERELRTIDDPAERAPIYWGVRAGVVIAGASNDKAGAGFVGLEVGNMPTGWYATGSDGDYQQQTGGSYSSPPAPMRAELREVLGTSSYIETYYDDRGKLRQRHFVAFDAILEDGRRTTVLVQSGQGTNLIKLDIYASRYRQVNVLFWQGHWFAKI
jgi:hypothetical protein